MRKLAGRRTKRGAKARQADTDTDVDAPSVDATPGTSSTEVRAAEIAKEQAYFDRAADRRLDLLEIDNEKVLAGATSGGQVAIRRQLEKQADELGGPDDPVAFGRIDTDDGETLYIGRALIQSDDHEPIVVSMKAPIADAFYSATVADPHGLNRKRTFRTTRNHIENIDDLVFAQLAADIEDLVGSAVEDAVATARVDDGLLDELSRHRSGEMAEIAKTIQASQHAIITAPYDRLLVIQGGPGTGKTAVALHRLSWMLYRERDTVGPSDVLVVGPNPTFVKYISRVLPELGDRDVQQTDIKRLCAPRGVIGGRQEDPGTAALKGERRMGSMLRRGLRNRIGATEGNSHEFGIGTRTARFTPLEINQQTAAIIQSARTYRDGRDQFRNWVSRTAASRAGVGETAIPPQQLDQFTDRIWPQITERALLRDLFGSRDRLLAAAGELFTAAEVSELHRPAATRISDETWSDADLPLLDFAARGINGTAVRHQHVVVDEAQDLSPMELRAIRARMAGGATVVGDVAQSTGPWARDTWDDVRESLSVSDDDELVHLELGYRVPAEVFEVATRVLRIAAPRVAPPKPVRVGGHEPTFVLCADDDIAANAVTRARVHSGNGNSVGIVCPAERWSEVAEELDDEVDKWVDASTGGLGSAINMISPHDAKGLEFDAVVVVDPAAIVGSHAHGARLLYVALTRTTTHLDVVHTGDPLPGLIDEEADVDEAYPLDTGEPELEEAEEADNYPENPFDRPPDVGDLPAPPQANRIVDVVSKAIADDLRSTISPDQYDVVLERIRRLLDE